VNLFYRSRRRELAIKQVLERAGANEVLGVGKVASAHIPEICSDRRRVDSRGILTAIELRPAKMGKTVIAIDLNPLSRTAQHASITIVDNVVRTLPFLVDETRKLKNEKLKPFENWFFNIR